MTGPFLCRFPVRHYELDAFQHLNNIVHVRYMEEAAIQHSTHLGHGPEWYRAQGTGWVIRRLTIRYLAEAVHGDEIEVATWIARMRGVSCLREYDLKRTSDGARVARARVKWVYLDLAKGQPLRIPPKMIETFAPTGEDEEDLGVRITRATATDQAHRYRSSRRVQFHELDTAQHVNHAEYLQWTGQAYFDALRAAGYPLERMQADGWLVVQGGHDIEYFEPARNHDDIDIVSWIREMARVRGAWTHEIFRGGSDRLLARNYALGIFVNPEGRPTSPPAKVVEEVLRGPG